MILKPPNKEVKIDESDYCVKVSKDYFNFYYRMLSVFPKKLSDGSIIFLEYYYEFDMIKIEKEKLKLITYKVSKTDIEKFRHLLQMRKLKE